MEMDARDLPPGFEEAGVIIREAIARIAANGIAIRRSPRR
jgi:hypothetical protein